MKQPVIATVLALGLSFAAVGSASAQVRGLPVYNSGVSTGLGLSGDVGFPNDAAGGGTAFGLTGQAGFGPFGVTATVASFSPEGDGDNITSLGGTANFQVFGGPLIPVAVTLQGGVGYAKVGDELFPDADVTDLRFPIGLSLAVGIPNPAFSVRPWVAPRLDITRRSGGDLFESQTETDFAVSGGVEMNFLMGLGLHAAVDWVAADGDKPLVFGAGLHYAFRVPGL